MTGGWYLMGAVLFRGSAAGDAETVARLHAESWLDAYRDIMPDWYLDGPITKERQNLWKARFSSPDPDRQYILLAEADARLVGFVCVLLDEEPKWGACLDNLHVLPGLRNKGIGRKLFIRATQWVMSAAPGIPMHLWVLEANSAARRLYDALGGEIVSYQSNEIVKGIDVPSVLYVWKDLKKLWINLKG